MMFKYDNFLYLAGDPCRKSENDFNGISFKASYNHLPGETFFSNLFTFSEVIEECPFDAFIPIDGNYTAHGIRLFTKCPILKLGKLIFPEMSHSIGIIGSNPDCFEDDFLGVSDPALVIHSKLTNERLPLGLYLELQRRKDEDDMTVVFERNSKNFVALLHSLEVTIFGTSFDASGRIENNVLKITGNVPLFGFPANIRITALTNITDWSELSFVFDGIMLSGNDSFFEKLIIAVIAKLDMIAKSGEARQRVAKMALSHSISRLKDIQNRYNQSFDEEKEANQSYYKAVAGVEVAKNKLSAIESMFNSSNTELKELEDKFERVCTEQFCESVCMSGKSCSDCTEYTFINKTTECPVTVKEVRSIRVPPFYIETTEWRFVGSCNTMSGQVCFDDDCLGMETTNCYGKCVPITSTVPVYNWREVEVDVLTVESCTIEVVNSSVPSTCCEITNCAIFAPTNSCVSANVQCRQTRELALNNAKEARGDVTKFFQELQNCRRNLSVALNSQTSAKIRLERSQKRLKQLLSGLNRVKEANKRALSVYENTVQQLQPALNVSKILSNNRNDLQNVFNITNITFITAFMDTLPLSIETKVTFETPYNMREYHNIFRYEYSRSIESVREIACIIVENAFIPTFGQRSKRQSTEQSTNRQIFDARCTHLVNTQLFFSEIHAQLQNIHQSIINARETSNILPDPNTTDSDMKRSVNLTVLETEFNTTLPEQEPMDDEEIFAYLELLKIYTDLSAESLAAFEDTIFSEWQVAIEYLYSESGSVGSYSCDGFADCLQTAVDELQNLINLTPVSELREHFKELYKFFPQAEIQLLELAIAQNLSISEAIDKITPIINITNVYAVDNYWCNPPPVITVQPPPDVNVSLGSVLELYCEAKSSLPVTYEWKKDGNTLAKYTTMRFILANLQHFDSGNYTCFAINPVGTAESITTSVTVYELPSFYLLPQSVATFFGDENGAWFACNATAFPYPGWRWYYRPSEEVEWKVIEGEQTNELLIPKPLEEQEGLYMCEAFNYHGSIRADPVSLTLLPFSVSQQQFPLEFSLSKDVNNTLCRNDDLLGAVYRRISHEIGEVSTEIEYPSITQIDSDNFDMSLSLFSKNVTTRYLRFMSISEIVNIALPTIADLRKSVQSITKAFRENVAINCKGTRFTVIPDSLSFDHLTYNCSPGQALHSDYLLCCKL